MVDTSIDYNPMEVGSMPSITRLAEMAGLTRPGWTYDTALPQEWVDRVVAGTSINPVGFGIVWAYGPNGSGYSWGVPFALTPEAHVLLAWARSLKIA